MKNDLLDQIITLPTQFPGMDALTRETAYLLGCRSFSQFCCSLRAFADPHKFCPFCTSELERRGRKPFATIGEWMLLSNEFPHKNTAQMWLIVPKHHLTDADELLEQDWGNIGKAFAICRADLGIRAGGIMFRFGDPRFNVGTVDHLHFNVIQPVCGKEYRPPFAKNMPEHADDYQRLLGFRSELMERADILGSDTWLFSPEGIGATQPKI